ncbi:MAG: hypothetical protein C5B50_21970 [Verrucomicrobia bacterium]|nr:MAG: hypothetical protein C5B50_21970 [Verrucomicrobiota bacterium]
MWTFQVETVDLPGDNMSAAPLLEEIIRALARRGLEGIMIGNAAAAIQGAPVTTLDFDFMFRATPTNLTKLKRFADDLDAVILRPFYPMSKLYPALNEKSKKESPS